MIRLIVAGVALAIAFMPASAWAGSVEGDGASYATEKCRVEYVDKALAVMAKGLTAALPGKPLIDIVDASEDESQLLIIAFDWLVQFLAAQGFVVIQPNYRGSSGYGAAWFGRNGFQAWETVVGDVADAGRWLIAQGMADPARLSVVGWSYGGYATLQTQVLDPTLFKSVAAVARMTDLELRREDARPYTNYSLVDRFIGKGVHVKAASPAQHADRFVAPVLLFHGTFDQNVDSRHSRFMKARLEAAGKVVRYIEYKDLEHGLNDSSARQQMLREIASFLGAK